MRITRTTTLYLRTGEVLAGSDCHVFLADGGEVRTAVAVEASKAWIDVAVVLPCNCGFEEAAEVWIAEGMTPPPYHLPGCLAVKTLRVDVPVLVAALNQVTGEWIPVACSAALLPLGAYAYEPSAVPLLQHDFLEHPWGKDICDKKLDDDGQVRTCTRPRWEHRA